MYLFGRDSVQNPAGQDKTLSKGAIYVNEILQTIFNTSLIICLISCSFLGNSKKNPHGRIQSQRKFSISITVVLSLHNTNKHDCSLCTPIHYASIKKIVFGSFRQSQIFTLTKYSEFAREKGRRIKTVTRDRYLYILKFHVHIYVRFIFVLIIFICEMTRKHCSIEVSNVI